MAFVRWRGGCAQLLATVWDDGRHRQRKGTGSVFTQSRYCWRRVSSSSTESTRIPRKHCFASLAKNISIRFSQEAWTGVNTNSKRLGLVAK